jgi:uncharacterized protein (UPF0548 family)
MPDVMPGSNFAHPGITRTPVLDVPDGYRVVERRTALGSGVAVREAAIGAVLRWEVKTRAGFRVHPSESVVEGNRYLVTLGPVKEPVQVLWVDGRGFGYGTLDGHPLSGEEAFLIELDASGGVWFVNRSVSRPAGAWVWLTPLLRLAQAFYVRRYGRVLRQN